MNIKKFLHNKKGISIIETVIAVLIISFAIGAPIGVLYQGLRFSQMAKERVEARFFAEEPIEYIRNLKDSNIVKAIHEIQGGTPVEDVSVSFDEDIPDCSSSNYCLVDVFIRNIQSCMPGECLLRYTDSSWCDDEDDNTECFRKYGQDTSVAGNEYEHNTIYTREVNIENISNDEFSVVVKVSWTDRQENEQTLSVKEFFRSFGID